MNDGDDTKRKRNPFLLLFFFLVESSFSLCEILLEKTKKANIFFVALYIDNVKNAALQKCCYFSFHFLLDIRCNNHYNRFER